MQPQEFWRNGAGYLWRLITPAPLGTPDQEPPGWGVGAIVRDIPDVDLLPGTIDISEGDRVVTHWDPGWKLGSNVELVTQMVAPSRDFYVARQTETTRQKAEAETALVEAQAEVGRIDAMETDATTIAAVKLLNAPEGADPAPGLPAKTPYEKRADARAAVAQIDAFLPSVDAAIVDVAEVIAAVDSLGRDFIPVAEVAAEVERLRL
ncbi:hypothetical protein LCGC14_0443380 [marine sediment metagenome]|uniref:Uncharacterized protein n=1 Tax=marine sediment metagenome TaxID=412755 RepID=A0A0F9T2T1_9ZZZZ